MKDFKVYQKDGMTKIVGVAYSGEKIKHRCWEDPFIIDMENILLPPTVPLVFDDGGEDELRIGTVTAHYLANMIFVKGVIDSKSPAINDIVQSLTCDDKWMLNIVTHGLESKWFRSEKGIVNGMEQNPPFCCILKSELWKIKVFSDRKERERVKMIQKICDGEFPEIERDAICYNWSTESAAVKVLDAVRKKCFPVKKKGKVCRLNDGSLLENVATLIEESFDETVNQPKKTR